MRTLLLLLALAFLPSMVRASDAAPPSRVYVIPVRTDIDEPLTYLVRRGVKEAMEAKADLLILDMDTNGGRVDVMVEIIEIVSQFKGRTATFVNTKAFSAGALISFGTQQIFMSPDAVIGAAAPVMASGGGGAESMSDTMEAKSASAISAMMRVNAEKHGHNPDLIDAMVKKTRRLEIDGKVLNQEGEILTLTANEALEAYGDPPKPLLAAGIVHSLEQLLIELGAVDASVTAIEPTGAEQLAFWINKIAPLLLLVGIVGFYIEFKTPGFGLPGIVGLVAFAVYFLGGYVAGLSGIEWIAVFVLGVTLVILELFVFPGTIVLGVSGAGLVLLSLVMAGVDFYPEAPRVPTLELDLGRQFLRIGIAVAGAIVAGAALARLLPNVPVFNAMMSTSASGQQTVEELSQRQAAQVGMTGVAVSPLRPGGKAQFGDAFLDVVSEGESIEKGTPVRIIGHSGAQPVVAPAENAVTA